MRSSTRLRSNDAAGPLPMLLEPNSPDQEAVSRLRQAALVGLIVELILPFYQTIFPTRADWLAIEILAIWFALTLSLLVATWHPGFVRDLEPRRNAVFHSNDFQFRNLIDQRRVAGAIFLPCSEKKVTNHFAIVSFPAFARAATSAHCC